MKKKTEEIDGGVWGVESRSAKATEQRVIVLVHQALGDTHSDTLMHSHSTMKRAHTSACFCPLPYRPELASVQPAENLEKKLTFRTIFQVQLNHISSFGEGKVEERPEDSC
ncbi:hypothetical protein MHYP_G00305220 [Metynnis hypsauchen]